MPRVKLLIIPISTPLMIGVYDGDELVESRLSDEKVSVALLPIISKLLAEYDVTHILYTRGPGSYMAIKLTYIILKTIEILRGIRILGCSAFELNGARPIKAIGELYFVKEKETIITKKFSESQKQIFKLPQNLSSVVVDMSDSPEYHLSAV